VDLSVIVVNWNTRDLLARCLASISANPPVATYEVWVVDNASTDGSRTSLQTDFQWVRLIANDQNVGFAGACNQAMRLTDGRYVLLLNADTAVADRCLDAMLGYMDSSPTVGLMGPALLDERGDVIPSWAAFPTLWSEIVGLHRRRREPVVSTRPGNLGRMGYQVDWLAGACLMTRRQAIEMVGYLDERFFLYSEETDWCLRMKSAGWSVVYYPGASVYHLEGASSRLVSQHSLFLLHRSKVLYARKHLGSFRAFVLKWVLIGRLLAASVDAIGGPRGKGRSRLCAAWEMLRV
jgi:N-acetylglucosaminyl-diphospho-decaprenol L-rhamnosyltransferase